VNPVAREVPAATQAAVSRALDRLLEIDPVMATRLGDHRHDDRLPEGGSGDVAAEIAVWRELEEAVAGEEGLDADVARYAARWFRFRLEGLRIWEGMADASENVGTAIFLLFARDHAPLQERLEPIAARLEDVPRYLRASRERLRRPVRIWNEVELGGARELPSLFQTIASAPAPEPLRRRLEAAAQSATVAATEYAGWLEEEVLPRSADDSAIGEAAFEGVLRHRLLPGSADDILALGRDYLAQLKEERAELVAREWPGLSDDQALARVRNDRAATFGESLDEYRETMARAREFVGERGLVTLPEQDVLEVLETPAFLRPLTPFAAYEPPAYLETRQVGLYYVTPPATEADMGENNRASIVNTSVHEAYPGHHLQFACANTHPSLARMLSGFIADEFVEGWAHYCEQLMFEEGFSNTPELRLIQLNDLIWRACRVVCDVELSRGRMRPAEAVRMLVEESRMDVDRATAEVQRYTFTPGYQLSYLYGRHLLMQLRDRVRAGSHGGFELRKFHDTLLYSGSLPAAFWDRLFPPPRAEEG
jgi:uncharacterized protein DUF885